MFKHTIFIFAVFYFVAVKAVDLKVSVFYEVLCGDSKQFVTTQLYPAFKSLNGSFDIELVPFGKASYNHSANGSLSFICQHGPNECHGNQYHACVINQYPPAQSLEFVYCSMSSASPSSDEILENCSKANGISWDALHTCFKSGEGAKLLAHNGDISKPVVSETNFVPTVEFNGKYNATIQDQAIVDFKGLLCDFYRICPN